MNASPDVLISIVTWNHEKTIKATLDSILRQTYKNCRIIIFDNHSGDNTLSVVRPFLQYSNIAIIENDENIGFCGGHNHVIKNYSFDYLLLVNPDIVLQENYIEQTLQPFSKDNQIGAVCGLLLQSFDENPLIDSAGMELVKARRFTLMHHGKPLQSVSLISGYVAGLDGALPMFKKEAVESLMIKGMFFNELFFAHKEDWDVSWRLLLYGWKTYFNKTSVAIHPRHFRPNDLKYRLTINKKIKYDAFKNQFLLLLINEDRSNFLKDAMVIVPRIFMATLFCVFLEKKSLRAFLFIYRNRKVIWQLRKIVQEKRKISVAGFRNMLQ